jgi:hypothetical protein
MDYKTLSPRKFGKDIESDGHKFPPVSRCTDVIEMCSC